MFIVEDGTGLVDSTSYATVAFADAYFADRANSSWSGTTEVKEAALIRATDYIESRFSERFKGKQASNEQALSFPRSGLYDINGQLITGVPLKLQKACVEYAVRALTIELMPDPIIEESGFLVTGKTEKVGPIEESTSYSGGRGSIVTLRPYPSADRLLMSFITTRQRVIRG